MKTIDRIRAKISAARAAARKLMELESRSAEQESELDALTATLDRLERGLPLRAPHPEHRDGGAGGRRPPRPTCRPKSTPGTCRPRNTPPGDPDGADADGDPDGADADGGWGCRFGFRRRRSCGGCRSEGRRAGPPATRAPVGRLAQGDQRRGFQRPGASRAGGGPHGGSRVGGAEAREYLGLCERASVGSFLDSAARGEHVPRRGRGGAPGGFPAGAVRNPLVGLIIPLEDLREIRADTANVFPTGATGGRNPSDAAADHPARFRHDRRGPT